MTFADASSSFPSYLLGLSTMFFGMMAVFFWRRGERLRMLVTLLMGTIALEYVKDYVFMVLGLFSDVYYWGVMTITDMVAVPMYAFVLMELVRPGRLTVRRMLLHEVPFVLSALLYVATGWMPWVYAIVGWAVLYGTFYLVWTAIEIPRYNRHLMESFSYTENVNLGWLRVILYTFYVILGLWVLDCVAFHIGVECLYMGCNLVLWMVISFFLFRHESVIDELSDNAVVPAAEAADGKTDNSLAVRIEALFATQKVFLDPGLKLSDVARAVGSNRTYVSNYFNRDAATTFYDYVNTYRIEYACVLLADPAIPVQEVAERSGFSGASVFSRVFAKHKGCTPTAFRSAAGKR